MPNTIESKPYHIQCMDDVTMSSNDDFETEEVEYESGNEDVIISVPFNPSLIKVVIRPYSVGQIISDLRDGVIDFETEFQRLPGLWDIQKKSRFIESLLLNLPIPAFYFNENVENNWEVVDGLQRVSTLKQYVIENGFKLKNLEFLNEYNGYKFQDLPITLQKRITRFPVTLNIIEKGTPHDVKYNVFKRINQGGLVLKPQEIRHAINQGKPSEVIADLVRSKAVINEDGTIKTRRNFDDSTTLLQETMAGIAFARATDYKIGSSRMEDRDFATRFVSFYLLPYHLYEPDLDTFLNRGMSKISELNTSQIEQLKLDFTQSMNLAYEIFAQYAFRKIFSLSESRRPINKALFEVLSVNFAKLSDSDCLQLVQRRESFISRLIDLMNHPDRKFVSAITQATAQREKVQQRFNDIARIINETIEND